MTNVIHAAENIKGGVGTYLRDLLQMQAESLGAGEVAAVVPASQCEILGSPAGVELIKFDDSGSRPANTLRLARLTVQLVAARKPRIAHLHSTFAGAALRPLLKLNRSGTKVIYCAHGWAFDRQTSPRTRDVAMRVERALAHLCDAVVCVSDYEMRAAVRCGLPRDRLVLVCNGIPREAPKAADYSAEVEWPSGVRRILFVGRFDRQKGVDVLLEALGQLRGEAFAYLAGAAVLRDSAAMKVPDNVRLTGWLTSTQLEAFYRTADVLVVPSRWEAFGLIAAEAMRAGLPVIATRVGALPELVEDGVTGVLVPPDDSRALVAALRAVTDSQLQAMGPAGREVFLRRFTMDRVHRQLLKLYQTEVSHGRWRAIEGAAWG
jgi:glycosyltransferase involved in cell wall biosynthesis